MKVVIAGSRHIGDYEAVVQAALQFESDFGPITEVVSGGAQGVDYLGEKFAESRGMVPVVFEAKWDDLTAPNARIKTGPSGSQYNANAGFDRNEQMAQYADALVLVWDGKSHGSLDMLRRAKKHKLLISKKVVK